MDALTIGTRVRHVAPDSPELPRGHRGGTIIGIDHDMITVRWTDIAPWLRESVGKSYTCTMHRSMLAPKYATRKEAHDMARDPITKSDIAVGTRVIITGESLDRVRFNLGGTSDIVEVTDMMDRTNYCKPDRIGVKRSGTGLALGIAMSDIVDVLA